jgi:hypothetical protein
LAPLIKGASSLETRWTLIDAFSLASPGRQANEMLLLLLAGHWQSSSPRLWWQLFLFFGGLQLAAVGAGGARFDVTIVALISDECSAGRSFTNFLLGSIGNSSS